MALILNESDLQPLFQDPRAMTGAMDAVEAVIREFARGEAAQTPFLNLPWVADRGAFRGWAVSSVSEGAILRLSANASGAGPQPDTRFIMLFDGATGSLLLLMPDEEFNVVRTGAPAGVAARHLAPPTTSTLAILGSGKQARGQALALTQALPALERVRVFSPNPDHRRDFAQRMQAWLGKPFEAVGSAREAVEGADVVSVSTSSRTPALEAQWVQPGALVISIAGFQLPQDLITTSRVVLSSRRELVEGPFRREPYLSMIEAGTWSTEQVVGDLGEVIAAPARARRDPADVVLYEMPGLAIWDLGAARWVYQWATAHSAGTPFHLSSAG